MDLALPKRLQTFSHLLVLAGGQRQLGAELLMLSINFEKIYLDLGHFLVFSP